MSAVALKHLCAVPPAYGLNISPDRYRDEGIRLLRTSDIADDGALDADAGVFVDVADVPSEMRLRTGDVLFSRSGTVGRAFLFDEGRHGPATYAGFLVRFRLRDGVDPRAIRYWSESASFVGEVAAGAVQSTILNFNAERYSNLDVPAALVSSSRVVADYLEAETARIEGAISARRHQAKALTSRTEGLLADLLDPLVERCGELPLKAVADVRYSNIDKKSYEGEKRVRLCNYTDVYYNRRINGRLDFMEATATSDQIGRFTLREGDVLLTKDSETAEDIAVPAFVTEDLPGVVLGYHLALIRPTKVEGAFVYWALRSRRCRDALSLAASGVTRFGLRQDAVGRVSIPHLDPVTARRVVQHVEREVESAEWLVATLGRQIDLLLERRQALITAAVTGQLGIPGVAA